MSGLHDLCHANERRQADEYTRGLKLAQDAAGADALIGQAIRELLQPGVKRRTWRAEELREIVERADRRFSHNPPINAISPAQKCGEKFGRVAEYGAHRGYQHTGARWSPGNDGPHVCHCRITSNGWVR